MAPPALRFCWVPPLGEELCSVTLTALSLSPPDWASWWPMWKAPRGTGQSHSHLLSRPLRPFVAAPSMRARTCWALVLPIHVPTRSFPAGGPPKCPNTDSHQGQLKLFMENQEGGVGEGEGQWGEPAGPRWATLHVPQARGPAGATRRCRRAWCPCPGNKRRSVSPGGGPREDCSSGAPSARPEQVAQSSSSVWEEGR